MKTELEKKLNKLPAWIDIKYSDYYCTYKLKITKTVENNHWFIEYTDCNHNSIIIVEHKSLQAAVDSTLATINKDNLLK